VFDLPPIRFIAIASVVWASREIEPNDIAPVEKRLTIETLAGSTSSSGTGVARLVLGRLDAEQAAHGQSRSLCSLSSLAKAS
jgi:hypothetical protein